MTVSAEEMKRKILKTIKESIIVEKTNDFIGRQFRHEHFSVTFDLPNGIRIGCTGIHRSKVKVGFEVETPKDGGTAK